MNAFFPFSGGVGTGATRLFTPAAAELLGGAPKTI
jgi:hypothetical protein